MSWTPERRAKISAALKGRKRPASVGEKVRAKLQACPPREEVDFMIRIYQRLGMKKVGELTGYSTTVIGRVLRERAVPIRPPAFARGKQGAPHA